MSRTPIIPGALAERTIRPGRKRVLLASGPDTDGKPTLPLDPGYDFTPAAARAIFRLIRALEDGAEPAAMAPYYRKSGERRGDALLLGPWRVMHLHLWDAGPDHLVYLIQRDDDVIIIVAISDHRHLEPWVQPPGKALRRDRATAAARRAPYSSRAKPEVPDGT